MSQSQERPNPGALSQKNAGSTDFFLYLDFEDDADGGSSLCQQNRFGSINLFCRDTKHLKFIQNSILIEPLGSLPPLILTKFGKPSCLQYFLKFIASAICPLSITLFKQVSNSFISKTRLRVVKILATFKQNAEAQFSVISFSNSIPPSKSLPYLIKIDKN